ncbi:hypothetical protein [Otoolea muris]
MPGMNFQTRSRAMTIK